MPKMIDTKSYIQTKIKIEKIVQKVSVNPPLENMTKHFSINPNSTIICLNILPPGITAPIIKLPDLRLTIQLVVDCLVISLSLIHISEPTRLRRISYAVFCLKKKK